MAYDIHIKTTDGSVNYPSADSYKYGADAVFILQVGGDEIRYSPYYWQAISIDPASNDPFDLD